MESTVRQPTLQHLVVLLIVQNRLRGGFTNLELRAHLLQSRGKRFNLFLLLSKLGLKVLL